MEHLGTWALGVALWHVGTLQSLGLVSGAYAKSRWFLPREVLLSRYHLAGIVTASLAVFAPIVGERAGSLATGFVIAAFLAMLDTYLIYRAVTQR